MPPISLQIYTLRAEAAEDFFGVLRTVAATGYKGVELGSLYGHSVQEVTDVVHDLGMQISGDWPDLPTEQNIADIVAREKTLQNTQIVCGFWKDEFATVEACRQTAARIGAAARLAQSEGLTLSMHNHWWEFRTVEGRLPFDILMEEPDFRAELDIYWAATAGVDPAPVLARYGNRIPLLHVKDGFLGEEEPMTAVGSGSLDIPGILGAANPDVLQWLVVELDRCDTDMTEAVRQSYAYLTENDLAAGSA